MDFPNTFLSTATSAIHCGAEVDFVDTIKLLQHVCPIASDKLEKAAKEGTLPKIVVPVHYAGQSWRCRKFIDWRSYTAFDRRDASHAIGKDTVGK